MNQFFIFLAIFFIGEALSFSQDMPVPLNTQVPLFIKILSFDRNLASHADSVIVVGILYQGSFRSSLNEKNDFLQAVEEGGIKTIDNLPVRFELIDLTQTYDIENILIQRKIKVVYLTELRGIEISSISEMCQSHHVITLSGVP